jgi:hypothetical protein
VTIVVPVFITNCHVSLNLNIGPVITQARITRTAMIKVTGLPLTLAVHFAKRVNHDLDFGGLIFLVPVRSRNTNDGSLKAENYSVARIPRYFRNQSAARFELTSNPAKE